MNIMQHNNNSSTIYLAIKVLMEIPPLADLSVRNTRLMGFLSTFCPPLGFGTKVSITTDLDPSTTPLTFGRNRLLTNIFRASIMTAINYLLKRSMVGGILLVVLPFAFASPCRCLYERRAAKYPSRLAFEDHELFPSSAFQSLAL